MPENLRPLSTGELLDRTFNAYRKNFILFFGISAVPYLLVLIIQVVFLVAAEVVRGSGSASTVVGVAIIGVIGGIVFLIAYFAAIAMSQAATVFAVSAVHLGQSITIQQAFAKVKGQARRILAVMMEVGARVALGLLLLIVPGILLALRYAVAVPAAVLENLKRPQAIKRSVQLTEGGRGRIFVIYALIAALSWGFALLAGFLEQAVGLAARTSGEAPILVLIIQQAINTLASSLIAPVGTIAVALVYYDQRVRKEAFDIEHMMSALTQAAGTPTSTAAAATPASPGVS